VLSVLLLLLLLAVRHHRQHHECYAVVDNPDDDIRENIIHYDEEGVGMSPASYTGLRPTFPLPIFPPLASPSLTRRH